MSDALSPWTASGSAADLPPAPRREPGSVGTAPLPSAPDTGTPSVPLTDVRSFQALGRQTLGDPPPADARRATAAEVGRFSHTTLAEGGDLFESLCRTVGNMNHGLPSFKPCWENGAWERDLGPAHLGDRARDLTVQFDLRSRQMADVLQTCMDEAGKAGVHLGAGGNRIFPVTTYELVAVAMPASPPPPPTPDAPPPPVWVSAIASLDFPQAQALTVKGEMGHCFGSDCATFFGNVPPAFAAALATGLQAIALGKAASLRMDLSAAGPVRTGSDGHRHSVGHEAASYEATGKSRQALERNRSARVEMVVPPDGKMTVSVTATTDEVQSLLGSGHLTVAGAAVLRRFLSHRGVTCQGHAVPLTANDALAAMRAYAVAMKVREAACLQMVFGNPALSATDRLSRPPGEGGSWLPDLARQLAAHQISPQAAVQQAMANPAIRKALGDVPPIPIVRYGADGKPSPVMAQDPRTGGQMPLTLSPADAKAMCDTQVVQTRPSRPAVGRVQGSVSGGGVSLTALTKAWTGDEGFRPNAVVLSDRPAPLDLGEAPLGTGEDPAVVALIAHVDDGDDRAGLQMSKIQIDGELHRVAAWARAGMLSGGGLSRAAQTEIGKSIEAYLAQPDVVSVAQLRTNVLHAAGAGASAGFAQALIRRVQAGCRLAMALQAVPADGRPPSAIRR